MTYLSPEGYELEIDEYPVILGDDLFKIIFDFFRVGLFGEADPFCHPLYMGINYYGRDMKDMPPYNIGRLSPHAGKLCQFIDIRRHCAVMIGKELFAGFYDMHCLHVIEAHGMDLLFKSLQVSSCKIGNSPVFFKKHFCYRIYAFVRALCGQDGRYQKLVRLIIGKEAALISSVVLIEQIQDFFYFTLFHRL